MNTTKDSKASAFRKYAPAVVLFFSILCIIVAVMIGNELAKAVIKPPVEIVEIGDPEEVSSKNSDQEIALFRVHGIIRGSKESDSNKVRLLCLEIRKAAKDPNVKAAIFDINSPGGEVAASDTIRHALDEFKKTGKPVVCYFDSLAASGGYYIGSGGDWIVCHPQCFTGSIGVIIQAPNYKDLFDKTGLKMYTFKSGKLKDMLNGARDLNPEEMTYTQKLVDDTYDTFLGIVAKSRKLDAENLRNTVADGRVVLGTDAVSEKLVDENGYFQDAVKKARELAGGDLKINYRKINGSSQGLASALLGQNSNKIEVTLGNWNLEELNPGMPYMLYTGE